MVIYHLGSIDCDILLVLAPQISIAPKKQNSLSCVCTKGMCEVNRKAKMLKSCSNENIFCTSEVNKWSSYKMIESTNRILNIYLQEHLL